MVKIATNKINVYRQKEKTFYRLSKISIFKPILVNETEQLLKKVRPNK